MAKNRSTPSQDTERSKGEGTGSAAGAQNQSKPTLGSQETETASTIKTDVLPMQKKLGPMEAAEMVVRGQEKEKWAVVAEGKKSITVEGYEFKPYFKPKKQHLCKLILLRFNRVRGNKYQDLIARNCPLAEARRLMSMKPEEAQEEHDRRKKLPNYGFPALKRPKAA